MKNRTQPNKQSPTPLSWGGVGYLMLLFCLTTPLYPAAAANAALSGFIIEKESGQPIAFADILLLEINRSVSSDEKGFFFLNNLPAGHVTLKTLRIGYTNVAMPIDLTLNDTTTVTLQLGRAVIHLGGVTIESSRMGDDSPVEADILFSDKKLHQALGQTIAKTIDYEPGISQRSMGPAPSRPILRGLGGDRLLILEDQMQTGDLSATSSDHAVVIEPMTAERIEVIRGPEALVYGSKVLGGVVNVARGLVPSRRPTKLTGSATLQSESANAGYAGGVELTAPAGPLVLRVDGSLRQTQNMQTPIGTLINTDITTFNGSSGFAMVRSWGYAGAAVGSYSSCYGIPPDPNGGHPSGVRIDLKRQHEEFRGEYIKPWSAMRTMEFMYSRSLYQHKELEKNGRVGVEFGVVSHNVTCRAHLANYGRLENGILGIQVGSRNTASGGLTFTPNTVEQEIGLYYHQEVRWPNFVLHGAIRYDNNEVRPERERNSLYVGQIRTRSFGDVSAALSPHWLITSHCTIGSHLVRTFRAPTATELFSEGPHLAAYSYEIGNADLNRENAVGAELFLDFKMADTFVHFALFQNDIQDYIFPNNTGEKSWQRADLYVYQFVGLDALMRGCEMSFHLPLKQKFHAAGVISYVHGVLTPSRTPIPYLPPLEGKFNLGFSRGKLDVSASARAAAAQHRLGEFEAPTEGYVVFDLSSHYTLMLRQYLCTASFAVENVSNTVYRKHLNRVREIMPEQGRNFRLLIKMFI